MAKSIKILVISMYIILSCHAHAAQLSQPSTHIPPSPLSQAHSSIKPCVNSPTHSRASLKHKKVKEKSRRTSKKSHITSIPHTIATYLKTLFWGQNGWQRDYLRRLITCNLMILGGSLAKDIWPHNTQHKSEPNDPKKDPNSLNKADPVQPANMARKEEELRLLKDSQTIETECQERLSELKQYAMRAQEKREQLRAQYRSLPIAFVEAMVTNKLDKAVELLTDQIPEPDYTRFDKAHHAAVAASHEDKKERHLQTNHDFVEAVHKVFTQSRLGALCRVRAATTSDPKEAQNLLNQHIKSIIADVLKPALDIDLAIRAENTHKIALELFKIAVKLDSTAMTSELLTDEYGINKNITELAKQAADYERLDILKILKEKNFDDYYYAIEGAWQPRESYDTSLSKVDDVPQERAIRARALIYFINNKNRRLSYFFFWEYAVTRNDHEIMCLTLDNIDWNGVNQERLMQDVYPTVFRSENLYAMQLLLNKMKEVGRDINENCSVSSTQENSVLDRYLETSQYNACPLVTKLLINAGARLVDTRVCNPVKPWYLEETGMLEKRTPLECFVHKKFNNGVLGEQNKRNVVYLLVAERDKVNINNTAALCSAWAMGFTDQIQDIIVSTQESIHPRWISAIFALSDLSVRTIIKNAVREREQAWQAQEHHLSTTGTKEDNEILSTWLNDKMVPGIIDIIHGYMGIAAHEKQRPPIGGQPDDDDNQDDNQAAAAAE